MNKYVVIETRTYEIEAKNGPDALERFRGNAERELIKTEFSYDDWFTDDRKESLSNIIREALEEKLGEIPWNSNTKKWWAKSKEVLNNVEGWKAAEWEDLGEGSIHGVSNQKVVEVGIERVDEEIWYVSIPREDAFKVLTLGVPF